MANKNLVLFDSADTRDHGSIKRTEIIIAETETGKVVFKGENKVIVSGSEFSARCHFDLPGEEITPTYNSRLYLDKTITTGPVRRDAIKTYLFAVGTNGCGNIPSQVYEVNPSKWIDPMSLVPFRYCYADEDLAPELRSKYFGRKEMDDYIAYYFKAFEHDPVLHMQYADTSPIDNSVYDLERSSEPEVFVELKLQVTKEDCRQFFRETTGINDARLNTLSLLTCWAYQDPEDGFTYYQDIRPLTKYNFPNESLIDLSKGLDITYHLYY